MKKIIFTLLITLLLISCSTNVDNGPQYQINTVPVVMENFPIKFAADSITEIPMKYTLPTNCSNFYNIYYLKNINTRTVAVQVIKDNQKNCAVNTDLSTVSLKFKPTFIGTYHFKFWKSTDTAGVDTFYEYDAVVTH